MSVASSVDVVETVAAAVCDTAMVQGLVRRLPSGRRIRIAAAAAKGMHV